MEYVLSIGTNIGDRKENILQCIESLNLLPNTQVIKKSSIYETQPVGYDNQQNFYNICLVVNSGFDAPEMLGACLGIEAGFGRVRTIKNGPRIIDIDIIFAENKVINTKNLTVPHPRYSERRFVLAPLAEIFENGIAYGIDFSSFAENIIGQNVTKIQL